MAPTANCAGLSLRVLTSCSPPCESVKRTVVEYILSPSSSSPAASTLVTVPCTRVAAATHSRAWR